MSDRFFKKALRVASSIASEMCACEEDIEDATQNTMLRTIRFNIRSIYYVRKIARWETYNLLKKQEKQRRIHKKGIFIFSDAEIIQSFSDPYIADQLERALLGLTPKRLEIFTLSYYGYGSVEISRFTKTRPDAIRMALHYTRKQLKEKFT